MNITTKQITGLLWIIPGLVAFLIALIPTLIYPWPFTFDIFVHIQIAQVYSHYGFTLIDPLIDPPVGT
ncbi:MAG: 6-pyruvoyl tetrahydropterin synthase, partial [Methanobacterium sp.]